MPTITVVRRSDHYPPGTSVSVFPPAAVLDGREPSGSAIASGTVDVVGVLVISDARIVAGTGYALYAVVNGEHRYLRARSTADVEDRGNPAGTCDTTQASATVASLTASSGAFAIGQRIVGAGIPTGTKLVDNPGGGSTWTLSSAATTTATGVSVQAGGARVPVLGLGSDLVPQTIATTWQAKVRQRRAAMGMS